MAPARRSLIWRTAYDDAKHQVALKVKQTQKVEGRVGIFQVPVDVELTTASGSQIYPITVSKPDETFTLPAETAPLMVLFDKGGHLLKTAEFHKEKKEWLYQLRTPRISDRADAASALKSFKAESDKEDSSHSGAPKNDDVIVALADAATNDKAWGVRATAADTLGQIGGASAAKNSLRR